MSRKPLVLLALAASSHATTEHFAEAAAANSTPKQLPTLSTASSKVAVPSHISAKPAYSNSCCVSYRLPLTVFYATNKRRFFRQSLGRVYNSLKAATRP